MRLMVVFFGLLMVGCFTTRWVHPTKGTGIHENDLFFRVETASGSQKWHADYAECQAISGQAAVEAGVSTFESCLRGKGWTPQ